MPFKRASDALKPFNKLKELSLFIFSASSQYLPRKIISRISDFPFWSLSTDSTLCERSTFRLRLNLGLPSGWQVLQNSSQATAEREEMPKRLMAINGALITDLINERNAIALKCEPFQKFWSFQSEIFRTFFSDCLDFINNN